MKLHRVPERKSDLLWASQRVSFLLRYLLQYFIESWSHAYVCVTKWQIELNRETKTNFYWKQLHIKSLRYSHPGKKKIKKADSDWIYAVQVIYTLGSCSDLKPLLHLCSKHTPTLNHIYLSVFKSTMLRNLQPVWFFPPLIWFKCAIDKQLPAPPFVRLTFR